MKKKPFQILLAVSLLAECSDVIKTSYATYADAESDQAFSRGWLPAVMSQSSFDIYEVHDVDLNVGSGRFRFARSDVNAFEKKLAAGQRW